jgi:hypothetical protein
MLRWHLRCYFMLLTSYVCANFTTTLLQTDLSFLAGCSSEAKQAKCLTVLVENYTVDPNCVKASVGRARVAWSCHGRTFLKCFVRNEPNEREQSDFPVFQYSCQSSLFPSRQVHRYCSHDFFLLKTAPLNSSYVVNVWRPSINCRLVSGSKSWTQFSSPISIYASSRMRSPSSLSVFVSLRAPKEHWLLNALDFNNCHYFALTNKYGAA